MDGMIDDDDDDDATRGVQLMLLTGVSETRGDNDPPADGDPKTIVLTGDNLLSGDVWDTTGFVTINILVCVV